MAPYTFSFLGQGGEVVDRRVEWFEHDDHAIDAAGRADHPHAILVHQADRVVAEFPPLRPLGG